MAARGDRIYIDWAVASDVRIEGVSGVKGTSIDIEDLVRWARKERKRLRRDIKRGHERDAREAAKREAGEE